MTKEQLLEEFGIKLTKIITEEECDEIVKDKDNVAILTSLYATESEIVTENINRLIRALVSKDIDKFIATEKYLSAINMILTHRYMKREINAFSDKLFEIPNGFSIAITDVPALLDCIRIVIIIHKSIKDVVLEYSPMSDILVKIPRILEMVDLVSKETLNVSDEVSIDIFDISNQCVSFYEAIGGLDVILDKLILLDEDLYKSIPNI